MPAAASAAQWNRDQYLARRGSRVVRFFDRLGGNGLHVPAQRGVRRRRGRGSLALEPGSETERVAERAFPGSAADGHSVRAPLVCHARRAHPGTSFLFFGIVVIALLPLFARQQLGGDAVTFSLLLTSMGVGAVIGALIVPRVRQRFSRNAVVFSGTLLHAAATLAFGWTMNVYVAAAAMFFAGMAWMAVVNVLQVAMQMALPNGFGRADCRFFRPRSWAA